MSDESERSTVKWRIWEEAWAQSRHLEAMRSQYLGFFFTVLLGVTLFGAKEVADQGFRTATSLVLFSILALGVELLATFLLLAVARIGDVLAKYATVIEAIRDDHAAA
jgi:hypothetical protein